MTKQFNFLYNSITGKWIIVLSILVSTFWIAGNSMNVYQSPAVGMLFELLWLPMLLLLLLIPVLSVLILLKKNTSKLFAALSLVIISTTVLYLTLFK